MKEAAKRIKATIPIEAVVARYTTLVREGRNLRGRCPFPDHEDSTPSFVVRPQFGTWTCYGCLNGRGRRGDVISFVMEMHNLSFREAIEFLERGHFPPVPLKEEGHAPIQKLSRTDIFVLTTMVRAFSSALMALPPGSPPWRYLEQRGISPQTAARYTLGWGDIRAVQVVLRFTTISTNDLAERGFVLSDGNQIRLRFAGRITIPEIRYGKALYMTSRAISPGASLRYLSLPAPYSRVIFGLGNAERSREVWLVEGPFCALSLAEMGLQGIAALGAFPEEREMHMLRRYPLVTIVPQNDSLTSIGAREKLPLVESPASVQFLEEISTRQEWLTRGQINALEWAEALHRIGVPHRIVPLPPPYKDVNDLLVGKGKDGALKCICSR